MTEHACIVCPQLRRGDPRIYERAQCCNGCRSRLRSILTEIADDYRRLSGELMPSQGHGERVTGSKEPPLPLRVNPLDLTMPAPSGRQLWTPMNMTHPDDQTGFVSVATRLDSWVRDWRDTLCPRESLPRPSVRHLTAWLLNRLDDACDKHEAVDEFAGEMRDLLSELRRTIGTTEVKAEHLDVPCRRCDLLDLHRLPGQDRVECGSCGDLLTEDEYRRWCGLLAATVEVSA